jgi:hypothetical protein
LLPKERLTMIRDVDETLRNLLSAEMGKIPGCAITEKDQITFAAPVEAEEITGGAARVNLYLHDVRENRALRETGFRLTRKPGDSAVGVRQAPVSLDLSYLVTAYTGDDSAGEHRLLSDVLGVLLRSQDVPQEYLNGLLSDQGLALAVAQPDGPGAVDPPALWRALGGRMRTALTLVVTAEYNPYETRWTKVVRELVVAVGVGTPPQGPLPPFDLSSIRVSAAGIVLDQATEQPLPGVVVTADGWDKETMTDGRGFFSLLNLPPGPRTLRFRRMGRHGAEMPTVVPPAGRPELLEPCVVTLRTLGDADLAVETAARAADQLSAPGLAEAGRVYHASLSGVLRREDGRPAAYVAVRVGGKQTMTDGEGVYCFFDLPPGAHTVSADLTGLAKPSKVTAVKPEEEKPPKKEKQPASTQ